MTAEAKHTVVLDVMGADSGIECIVRGGLDAARRIGETMHLIFVGDSKLIDEVLSVTENLPPNVSVEHASDTVPMHVSATDGVRMRDSSISVGLRLLKGNGADAFVSPGNTGAVMATSLLTLGRIEGVTRPAITALFPTSAGKPTVVLDVGANADCKPQHLSQFAVMGSVYASVVSRLEHPRVGLLSIGEERGKGNELIFNAQNLLKKSKINFVGNIEGRDILSGKIDVAITDGFTGNILLKFAESIKPMLVKSVQRQIQTNIFSRVGAMLLLPFLKRMRNTFDYAESGGAPLLGVNGIVVICHGSSNAKAIANAISLAYEMAAKEIKKRIHDELITNHFGQNNGSNNKSENNRDGILCTSRHSDER
ncbi:MAG: phosphate acyltransferase PlsX [Candidatus Zixiibacteriota bacterium]|nr:MAG: phosphate acyltransferase PlsX [candidate division Zixibacteria bacterium]